MDKKGNDGGSKLSKKGSEMVEVQVFKMRIANEVGPVDGAPAKQNEHEIERCATRKIRAKSGRNRS